MSTTLRLEMTIAAIVLLTVIIVLIKRKRITIKYSIMWLIAVSILLIFALFPFIMEKIAHLFGFELLSNFVFFIILGMAILILLLQTIIVSQQKQQIKELIQEISLLKKDFKNEKKEEK